MNNLAVSRESYQNYLINYNLILSLLLICQENHFNHIHMIEYIRTFILLYIFISLLYINLSSSDICMILG